MQVPQDFSQWAIDRHRATNHLYDGMIPYEFHLKMVVREARNFMQLSPLGNIETHNAAYGHDLMEDTRVTFHLIEERAGRDVAEIIRAVTDDCRGRNREERKTEQVYSDIANTTGALFIKLCDRIANIQYSVMTYNEGKVSMYKKEQPHFEKRLKHEAIYKPMWDKLNGLFELSL